MVWHCLGAGKEGDFFRVKGICSTTCNQSHSCSIIIIVKNITYDNKYYDNDLILAHAYCEQTKWRVSFYSVLMFWFL